MKSIEKLHQLFKGTEGLQIKSISYTYQGIRLKRKGISIYWNRSDGQRCEQITIEPQNSSSESYNEKWMLYGDWMRFKLIHCTYHKNIWSVIRKIKETLI